MVNEDDLTENDSLNTLSGRRSESPTLRLAYSVSRSSPRSAVSVFILFFVSVFFFSFNRIICFVL